MDELYRKALRYDRMFKGTHDLAYWRELAEKTGPKVLEVACGTGRVAVPLAQHGCDVTGLDFSDAMLSLARQKASEAGASARFVQADMRNFDLGETYDLILIPNNSLGHLLCLDDVVSCFRSVKRHLKPAGCLAIDIFVPSLPLLVSKTEEKRHLFDFIDPDGNAEIKLLESSHYDPITQVKHAKFHYLASDGTEVVEDFNIKMFFPQELVADLRLCGLAIQEAYQDYQKTPLGNSANRQVILATHAH